MVLQPLADRFAELLRERPPLHVDETSVRQLELILAEARPTWLICGPTDPTVSTKAFALMARKQGQGECDSFHFSFRSFKATVATRFFFLEWPPLQALSGKPGACEAYKQQLCHFEARAIDVAKAQGAEAL